MQAITTKYLSATEHRGERVKASTQAGSITVGWDYALSAEQNHRAAAAALLERNEWSGTWQGGALPQGNGYAFVNLTGSIYRPIEMPLPPSHMERT
jgi:hypothetical protein